MLTIVVLCLIGSTIGASCEEFGIDICEQNNCHIANLLGLNSQVCTSLAHCDTITVGADDGNLMCIECDTGYSLVRNLYGQRI